MISFLRFIPKILFPVISLATAIFGILKLNQIPNPTYTIRKNYWCVALYGCCSGVTDIILCILTFIIIPKGTYGTGYELIASVFIFIIYEPICIVTSRKLQKRMSGLKEEIVKGNDMSRINSLILSAFLKAVFVFFFRIYIIEV